MLHPSQILFFPIKCFNRALQSIGVYPTLPKPQGQFSVGACEISQNGTLVHLFYPIDPSITPAGYSWIPHWSYAAGYGDFLKKPRWLIGSTIYFWASHVVVMSRKNEPIINSEQKFPIIIFSHGLGSWGTYYSAICCEMASLGYIVAAVEHCDGSAVAARNRKVFDDVKTYERLNTKDEFEFRNKQLRYRMFECSKVIDILKCINDGDLSAFDIDYPVSDYMFKFMNRFDMTRIGITGHSFGGGTAVAFGQSDDRISCIIALDAWMLPLHEEVLKESKKPIIFINADYGHLSGTEYWKKNCQKMLPIIGLDLPNDILSSSISKENETNQSKIKIGSKSLLTLHGSTHYDFGDGPIIFPLLMNVFKVGGPMGAKRCIELSSIIIKSFLHYSFVENHSPFFYLSVNNNQNEFSHLSILSA